MKQDNNQNTWQKQKAQNQKKLFLGLALVFVIVVIIAIAVPVSHVPLLNNIAKKFGLSQDIAKQLTLVDLAFSSFGVETNNMKKAFQKVDISYEPQVFLASRYETQDKRLLDARQMYYNEFEYTRKRPAEIAGIYQDGKEADIPEIAEDTVGTRAVPEENYLAETPSFGGGTTRGVSNGTVNVNGAEGQSGRKARQASDRDEAKRAAEQKINEALPQFANSIYDKKPTGADLSKDKQEQALTDTLDLNNSRIIQPILQGSVVGVGKKTSPIESIMSAGAVSHVLGTPGTFGGHGALGYYIADDLPKAQGRLLDYYYFGSSGYEAAGAYYYTYAAVSRRYKESAKYLAEISFNGDNAKEEILVAPGQSEDTVVRVANEDSPFEVMAAVKANSETCKMGKTTYQDETKDLKRDYNALKDKIKTMSAGHDVDGIENVSEKGAPGSCERCLSNADYAAFIAHFPLLAVIVGQCWGDKTAKLRDKWNNTIDELVSKCKSLEEKEKKYATDCGMDYKRDENKDNCNSFYALKVKGGTRWGQLNSNWDICRNNVKWESSSYYSSFNTDNCVNRQSCENEIKSLFTKIDSNIYFETAPDFVY